MLKFSRFYFQVILCGMTNKMLWEDENKFQISRVANSEKNTERPLQLAWEPDFNGFQAANHCHKSVKLDLVRT